MTKHSRNNTASSVFSYAEYKKLDYGTKRQRLGNESMRRFDACALCLQRAREPLSCHSGHLFCKECVYADLLAQKRDMKRQKAKLASMEKEAEEERERVRESARERVLVEFEKGLGGLGKRVGIGAGAVAKDESEPRGTKRKFEFDASAVEALTREAEEAALRQIEREQAEALKAKLPDFWLPSLTPTYTGNASSPRSLKDIKVQTTCRGGEPVHALSLKQLIPVKFAFPASNGINAIQSGTSTPASTVSEKKGREEQDPMCPSCKKTFSNSIMMILMKPCSHVVCKTCADTLVRPSKQCVVCDKEVGEKDIVGINREGTGFAGGGMAETKRSGLAFQG